MSFSLFLFSLHDTHILLLSQAASASASAHAIGVTLLAVFSSSSFLHDKKDPFSFDIARGLLSLHLCLFAWETPRRVNVKDKYYSLTHSKWPVAELWQKGYLKRKVSTSPCVLVALCPVLGHSSPFFPRHVWQAPWDETGEMSFSHKSHPQYRCIHSNARQLSGEGHIHSNSMGEMFKWSNGQWFHCQSPPGRPSSVGEFSLSLSLKRRTSRAEGTQDIEKERERQVNISTMYRSRPPVVCSLFLPGCDWCLLPPWERKVPFIQANKQQRRSQDVKCFCMHGNSRVHREHE